MCIDVRSLTRLVDRFQSMLAGADATLAQGWPNRSIRMVVPYTPGGYTDLMARLVGQKISEALGQPIVFENKPGANAIIGTDVVAKAAPDGYTFGTVIAAHAANATLNPKLPYDTLKDLTYVSLMSTAPLIMSTSPRSNGVWRTASRPSRTASLKSLATCPIASSPCC